MYFEYYFDSNFENLDVDASASSSAYFFLRSSYPASCFPWL